MKTAVQSVHGTLALHRVLEPDRTALLTQLAAVSGTHNIRKFPGANPCSLERAKFPMLKQQPYYLTEKTNGVRFLFFCCVLRNLNVTCIVDRAMAVFVVPLRAVPTAMFQGSVVDCELALNKVTGQWHLLAFDAYVVSGVPAFQLPFSQRMSALRRAMTAYEPHPDDPVSLRIKSFIPTSMFRMFLDHEREARRFFDVDGIILTPEITQAGIGRQLELFKLKTRHTVDFLVGADGVQLSVFLPGTRSHVPVAMLRAPVQAGAVAECERAADGVWDLVCVRTDKATANDMLTYERTLVNIEEGITVDELQRFFEV